MENPPSLPRMLRATALGLAAAVPVALVYGILADPFGLSLGLIVVGAIGGWLIGTAVITGAFSGRFHLKLSRVSWLSASIALAAWLAGVVVAYVASQFFYQGATTPLSDRLSMSGFFDYLQGSIISPSVLGLAAMAFTAWRVAR